MGPPSGGSAGLRPGSKTMVSNKIAYRVDGDVVSLWHDLLLLFHLLLDLGPLGHFHQIHVLMLVETPVI